MVLLFKTAFFFVFFFFVLFFLICWWLIYLEIPAGMKSHRTVELFSFPADSSSQGIARKIVFMPHTCPWVNLLPSKEKDSPSVIKRKHEPPFLRIPQAVTDVFLPGKSRRWPGLGTKKYPVGKQLRPQRLPSIYTLYMFSWWQQFFFDSFTLITMQYNYWVYVSRYLG